jgi:hypothetical protein
MRCNYCRIDLNVDEGGDEKCEYMLNVFLLRHMASRTTSTFSACTARYLWRFELILPLLFYMTFTKTFKSKIYELMN